MVHGTVTWMTKGLQGVLQYKLPFPELMRRVGFHVLNLFAVSGNDLLLTSIKRQAEMIIM